MARRKNTKRVDPKYFLEETALRDEVVNEGGDWAPWMDQVKDVALDKPPRSGIRGEWDKWIKSQKPKPTITTSPRPEGYRPGPGAHERLRTGPAPEPTPKGAKDKIVHTLKKVLKKYGPRALQQTIKKGITYGAGVAGAAALAPEAALALFGVGVYDAAAELGAATPGWSGGGKLLPTKDVDGSQEPYGIRDIGLVFDKSAPSRHAGIAAGHTSVPDYEYWDPEAEIPVQPLPAKKSTVTLDDGSTIQYDPAKDPSLEAAPDPTTFKRDPRLKSREIREEEDLEARLANLGREPREKDPLADLRAAAEEPARAPRGRKWHDDYAKRVSAEAQPNLAVQKPVSSPRDQYGSEELAPRASSGYDATWLDDPDILAAAQRGEAEVEIQNAYDQYVLNHPESGLSPTWLSDPDTLAAYADDGLPDIDIEAFSGKEKQKKAVPPSYKHGSTPMRETLRQMVMEELGTLKEDAEPVDLKENVELEQINETLTRWQRIIK